MSKHKPTAHIDRGHRLLFNQLFHLNSEILRAFADRESTREVEAKQLDDPARSMELVYYRRTTGRSGNASRHVVQGFMATVR